MKSVTSFCKPLTREQMMKITGGHKAIPPPACSNNFCYTWCVQQTGNGGACFNGECLCFDR